MIATAGHRCTRLNAGMYFRNFDPIVGASLYEAPELYLADSADLQMEGVDTASLFEAGACMTALYMLGFPKAAERAGMPSEFIVYPQTGRNIAIRSLQRESAQRNLEWSNSG